MVMRSKVCGCSGFTNGCQPITIKDCINRFYKSEYMLHLIPVSRTELDYVRTRSESSLLAVSAALPCGLRVGQVRQLAPSGSVGSGEIRRLRADLPTLAVLRL